jgi:hypothetical protein
MIRFSTVGKIVNRSDVKEITSNTTGNVFKIIDIVVEEINGGRYQDKVTADAIGDAAEKVLAIADGQKAKFVFSIHAREYEGKHYNRVQLADIVPITDAQPTGGETREKPAISAEDRAKVESIKAALEKPAQAEKTGDLPF